MRSKLAAVFFAFVFVLPAFGNDGSPQREAPPLALQEMLQGPQGARHTLQALRGKVVVLEFWATWCGPCVANIPHLNQLADQFAGKVQFIAIDDEPSATVKKFLSSHPMHAWVGLDQSQAIFRRYGVGSRPKTVVIDPTGKVFKAGVPEDVTPRLLQAAMKVTSSNRSDQLATIPATTSAPEPASRFTITLQDALPEEHYLVASDNGTVQARGASPLQIMGLLYEANGPDIVLEATLPDRHFNLKADAPGVKEAAMLKATQAVFDSSFQVTPAWEDRDREVYLLTADSNAKDKLTMSSSSHSYMLHQGTKLEDMKTGMPQFSAQLASILKVPVLDATGLKDRYDIAFTLAADTESAVAGQIEKLGLHIEKTRRVVRTLVVK